MFADRFKSKVLDEGDYLLMMSGHVHLLPIDTPAGKRMTQAQRLREAVAYPWSSLSCCLDRKRAAECFVAVDGVLATVGGRIPERPKRYRGALGEHDSEAVAAALGESPIAIGGEEFRMDMHDLHQRFKNGRKPRELKVYGRRGRGVARGRVVEAVCEALGRSKAEVMRRRKGSLDRPLLSWALYEYANMSQDEIAEFLGLKAGATVSQHTRKVREAREADPEFAAVIERVIELLD